MALLLLDFLLNFVHCCVPGARFKEFDGVSMPNCLHSTAVTLSRALELEIHGRWSPSVLLLVDPKSCTLRQDQLLPEGEPLPSSANFDKRLPSAIASLPPEIRLSFGLPADPPEDLAE